MGIMFEIKGIIIPNDKPIIKDDYVRLYDSKS